MDFVDINQNGIADDEDHGDWIRFEYTEPTKVEEGMLQGSSTERLEMTVPTHREWSSFSQTDVASSLMRERAYLKKIITPVQELDFTISQRFDVEHDYFTKPANYTTLADPYYWENRFYGTNGSASDFDIFYPVETMKYDSIVVKSRLIDKDIYQTENLRTAAIAFNYAAKGSAQELAVSEFLIRDNDNIQSSQAHNPSQGGIFDIDAYKGEDKRGKTTLLGIDLLDGRLDQATKTSYSFEYAYNPSFNEFHKREIIRKYSSPSLRTANALAYPKSTALISYKESVLLSSGTSTLLSNHSNLSPTEFKIDFPYQEKYYKLNFPTSNDIEDYVEDGSTATNGWTIGSTSITHPLKPIVDVFGYVYAENCSLCPEAWSLTKITYPTGVQVTFDYEQGEYAKSTDQPNWNVGENNFPVISQYNNLAKQRSYVQDAYNRYALSVIGSGVLQKTLTATFEVPLPDKYGIRLASKTINDRINPETTIEYQYNIGHFTSAPAEYVQSFVGGYNSFIQRERLRHQWEVDDYGPYMGSWFDFQDRMSYTAKTGFSLDEYEAIHFYQSISEIQPDDSYVKTYYGPMHGNTLVDYDVFNLFCYRYPGIAFDGRYLLARENLGLYPVNVMKTEYCEPNNFVYQSVTNSYERTQVASIDLNFDYTKGGSEPSTINMWGNSTEFFIYVPITQGFYSGDYSYGGFNITFINPANYGQSGFAMFENISVGGSLVIPTGANAPMSYERWGSFATRMTQTETNYKGLTSTTNFVYDPSFSLIEEHVEVPSLNEIFITQYEYAEYAYSNATTLFADKNLWNVPCRTTVYKNAIAPANVISAQFTSYDYTSYNSPRPLVQYQFETDVNANGTFTLTDYNITSGSNPKWRPLYDFRLDYNKHNSPISTRTNSLYNKSVFGNHTALPKAKFSYPEHSFDATYSGFEDLYGRYMIDEWDDQRYKDEDWFVEEQENINEPAFSFWLYNSPCHTSSLSCEESDPQLNVVTIDNISDLVIGDQIEIELAPSSQAVSQSNWSVTTTITGIHTLSDYFVFVPTPPQNLTPSWVPLLNEYFICVSDPIPFPEGNVAFPQNISGCSPTEYPAKAQSTVDETILTKVNPKYYPSETYARTGKYSYKLRTQRDVDDAYKKTPIRPVMIEALPVSNNCIDEQARAALSPEALIEACYWEYEASVWLMYTTDMVGSIPSGTGVTKSADIIADGIYEQGVVTGVNNNSKVKIICDIWNDDRTALLDQLIYYPEGLENDWKKYTVNVPVDKGNTKWLDVYVVNEKQQLGPISVEESRALFVDDICIYPKGAVYGYTIYDKFGSPTFVTNNNDVFTETKFDQKGRPIVQKNQYGTMVSQVSYFENPNWNNQSNHITERNWVDNGLYNEVRYYLDGAGKTKQVMISDVVRNARIVGQTYLYNNKGQITRSYKPYVLNGSAFGGKFNNEYDLRTQNLYGSYNAFTNVAYEAIPDEKIASVEPPRTNMEPYFAATQSDNVSTVALTNPYTNYVYPAGTVLIHGTVDANGYQVWTHMDNLGRVIMEDHEIGPDHIQNPDGSTTFIGGTGATAQTWFVYDGANRITDVYDPEGKHTEYIYNSLGVLIEKNSPDAGASKICYDKYGQIRMTQNAKDLDAVASNSWGTDQFSFLKYDKWGRVIESGFMEAASSNPSGIFTPTIFCGDTAYLNNAGFPNANLPQVQIHQLMEYDGSRDQFNSDALMSTTVFSEHQYTAGSMTYAPGKTDVTRMEYMADGQIASTEYEYDGLAAIHRFEPKYNGMRRQVGKDYLQPTNSLWDFSWNNELDNMGRVKTSETTHASSTALHQTNYYDIIGNLLLTGIGETGNPSSPFIDYQTIKLNIRDELVHGVTKFFRYGLKYDKGGSITDQFWSNEYFDPTTGANSTIHQYQYTNDRMNRMIGADYKKATVQGNPFAYYASINGTLPNDFHCGVNAAAFGAVFDPIFDEMETNLRNRIKVEESNQVINSLNILQAEYLSNDVAWASMDVTEQDALLAKYIEVAQSSSEDPHAWEKYRAEQLEDQDHLDLLGSEEPNPSTLKYTRINMNGIVFAPQVQCDPNPSATAYGYLPNFPYPSSSNNVMPYDVATWYAENGNIQTLHRNNETGIRTEQTYTYANSTNNRLSNVEWDDQSTIASHNYNYDLTGNLLNDSRNGVTNIQYISYNNMPQAITNSTGTAKYRYDGTQHRSVKDLSLTEQQYFFEGLVVDENNNIISYQVPGGYGQPASNDVRFYYYELDWKGTNRAVLSQDGVLQNVADHYPFGKRMPGRVMITDNEGNRRQFTGHEYDGETGYGYHGARYYNQELGRYMSVDRYADKFFDQSPYVYAGNRVIDGVDVNGDSLAVFDKNGRFLEFRDDGKEGWLGMREDARASKDENGKTVSYSSDYFRFSDPKNDIQALREGKITSLLFVKESDIQQMLDKGGAFDLKHKGLLMGTNYLARQGTASLDFSYAHIPQMYNADGRVAPIPNVEENGGGSSVLFYIQGDKLALNHFNFGNYLIGASANALEVPLSGIKLGGQMNSLKNEKVNGYSAQPDSPDDQQSISDGWNHANRKHYSAINILFKGYMPKH